MCFIHSFAYSVTTWWDMTKDEGKVVPVHFTKSGVVMNFCTRCWTYRERNPGLIGIIASLDNFKKRKTFLFLSLDNV